MTVNRKKTDTDNAKGTGKKEARRQTMILDFETYCDLADIKTEVSRTTGRIITLGEAISFLIAFYQENHNQG
jgi:hypothetical protein